MRHWPVRIVLIFMIVVILAPPATAQEKAFTRNQVQRIVRSGLGDESGAKLIEQQGVDFAPAEDFLQNLKTAGANEAFLASLHAVKHPEPTNAKKPINQIQVFALLAGQVPSHRVTMLVRERGIDFDPTEDYLQEVRTAGGEDELASALKSEGEIWQHVDRAENYKLDGQLASAETEYRTAIRRRPQDSDLHCSLGSVLGMKGDSEGEIAEYREAVRLDSKNEYAHEGLASSLGDSGDWEGAIGEYRVALRLNPDDDLIRVSLGMAFESKGDIDGAIAEFREALHPMPKDYPKSGREYHSYRLAQLQAHDAIGLALEQKGDWDGAIAEYREALRLNPKFGVGRLHLGIALESKGDLDGAIAEYREVLR